MAHQLVQQHIHAKDLFIDAGENAGVSVPHEVVHFHGLLLGGLHRVASRDHPAARLQHAKHLVQADLDVQMMVERCVADDHVHAFISERQGIGAAANPGEAPVCACAFGEHAEVRFQGHDLRSPARIVRAVSSKACTHIKRKRPFEWHALQHCLDQDQLNLAGFHPPRGLLVGGVASPTLQQRTEDHLRLNTFRLVIETGEPLPHRQHLCHRLHVRMVERTENRHTAEARKIGAASAAREHGNAGIAHRLKTGEWSGKALGTAKMRQHKGSGRRSAHSNIPATGSPHHGAGLRFGTSQGIPSRDRCGKIPFSVRHQRARLLRSQHYLAGQDVRRHQGRFWGVRGGILGQL